MLSVWYGACFKEGKNAYEGVFMRKWTFLACSILLLCEQAAAHDPNNYAGYLPHDPKFMQAEPYIPYTDDREQNEHYVPGSWLWEEQLAYFGFAPYLTKSRVRYRDMDRYGQPQIAGSFIDKAWKIEKGDPAVIIAIIDTGYAFDPPLNVLDYPRDKDVANRIFLNKDELSPPDWDPLAGPVWDKYGSALNPNDPHDGPDGRFSAIDYKDWFNDGRIADFNQNGYLDPQDIVKTLSNGVDDDSNGFVDDICGWDFFEDDNDPFDASSYALANHHSRGQLELAGAQRDNSLEGSGVCPDCTLLPIKNWDSFAVDTAFYGAGVLYATRIGASVIEGAIGGLNNTGVCQQAFREAYEAGLPIFIASSDLNTANHNVPTYLNEAIYCAGIIPDTYPIPNLMPTTYFRNSNVSQFGAKNQISFEVMSGSESTAMSSGAGGLLQSLARKKGVRLHPDQVKQLLTQTAEDVLPENLGILGTPDPAQVGWDQHFGYGRVDLYKALQWLQAGKIPPVARITAPNWSTVLNPRTDTLILYGEIKPSGTSGVSWVIEAGYGIEPTQFTEVAHGTGTGKDFLLAKIDLDMIKAVFPRNVDLAWMPQEPDPKNPWEADIQPNRHLFTIRITVMDEELKTKGDDRRTFFLHEDKALHAGWPQYIGAGGEGAVRFADLDGDNLKEVIVPTSDGRILVYTHNGRLVREFSARPFELVTKHNLGGENLRPGFFSIAVGDIDTDGIKEIAGAAGTWLYCFKATGLPQRGYPVPFGDNFMRDIREQKLTPDNHIEPGTMAAPVMHDLNGDGMKEIILGAGDQRVYAWDYQGNTIKGWPVYARRYATGAGIIHPPCLADLDGDGRMEVVVTTNEALKQDEATPRMLSPRGNQTLLTNISEAILPFALGVITNATGKDSLVYAIKASGTGKNSDGRTIEPSAFVDGWPVRVRGLLPDLLPQLGPSTKPCAYDYNGDGRDEVVAGFTSAKMSIMDGKGTIIKAMDQGPMGKHAVGIRDRSLAMNLFDPAAIGDINGDGRPEIVNGGMTFMGALNLAIAGQNFPFNHIIQAWDTATGHFLDAYPRTIDDHVALSEPALADVSGDGIPDVISGSGLYLIHAFGQDGFEKNGFPKLCGGWVFTTPAVDDIDNDGRNELAVVTREGAIFVWDTPGIASQVSGWPTYGHDNHNTSNLATDAIPPAAVISYAWTDDGFSFTCPGDDGFIGQAQLLKIFGANRPIDVTTISAAALVKQVYPATGGTTVYVQMPNDYTYYTVIAYDGAGNASQLPLSASAKPEEGGDETPASEGGDGGWCFVKTTLR